MSGWRGILGSVIGILSLPGMLLAQGTPSSPFRPYLFVFLAFGAAWLLIAAWAFRMGRKLARLSRRIEAESNGSPGRSAAASEN